MKIVKESNPVELADYAVNNEIEKELAFNWWVPFTLRKRDRIIKRRSRQNIGVHHISLVSDYQRLLKKHYILTKKTITHSGVML